ncbi:MAG TPA: sigma-54 dependent transcriptional regulator [Terracidiphilus sp.]|jgi:DNA-binding NtrC family response regulator|nr:sigma-54 dependent transcriptional regulator [Terracidiphilus sp.]
MIGIGLFSEDRALLPLLASGLGDAFELERVSTERDARRLMDAATCDVLILDLAPGPISPREQMSCAQRLLQMQTSVVVLAGDEQRSAALELVQLGAYAFCEQPLSMRALESMLERASEYTQLKRQLQAGHQRVAATGGCDRLIGSSAPIRQVYQLIHRVANLNASVLVTGESGTGKELIARAIHNLGSRADKPFVAVSCGAIPESLIEAELFGHEKGAFTGTVGMREGYFEQVREGTLFLDEIADLSLYTQVKLLRVLQRMEFSRLGSGRLIPLKARMIFATHQDLGKLVAEGKFRQDLYYRINVMSINSPALADHAEDIPQIATHYLHHYAQMFQKPMQSIGPEAMAMLQSYAWPGNVRELENTIQRAIILAPGVNVRPEDLPLAMHADKVIDISEYSPECAPDCTFERQLRDYKVRLAVDAVRDNNGNKTLAARSLGISRAYLHRLIRLADSEMPYEPESVGSASVSA